ncbi:MAG TPA: DNA polymerase III subunit gamma and tau [Streptosporangiaceae bacterium]|nr:DNA polymerase III subunit gamma and tau [Streptosporangiaceae bacterium]
MAAGASDHEETTPASLAQSGLALYRKYRPATFAELRGQEHVTGPLQQALRTGRINHAYLFSGPRGCGKTSSARILARSLNCVKGPTPEPCGVCDSCVALAPSGPGSIDVIEIDAASHGGVDDARDLRERAFYTPVSGRFKIYIIDEAHMVTQQGFNALLKLVEEPPPHLKFIFATTEPEKVIATIRSRTHHYPFRLVPPSVLRELMQDILRSEGVAVEDAVLPLVIRAGAGSARDSLSILDQLLAGSDESGLRYERAVALLGFTDAGLLDEIVDAFAAADGAGVFRVVNRVIEGGHEPRRFAADLLDRLRDLIVLAAVPDAAEIGLLDLAPDRAELMARQAERFGQSGLTRAAEIVNTGLDQMRGATSPRLLLELTCAQVLLPAAANDEKSLLARLERLERGAPPQAVPPSPPRPSQPGPAHDQAERPGPPASSPRPAAPRQAPRSESAPGPAVREPEQRGPDQTRPGQEARPRSPEQGRPAQSESAQTESAQTESGQRGPEQGRPAQPDPAPRAQEQPRPQSPEPGQAARPPAQAAAWQPTPGATGADSLRANWDTILDAVKSERRVAWMLLSNASVLSLEENVLTLRFPREGDVKGFSVSGHDAVLKRVLSERFGLNVTVRGMTGGDAAPPGAAGGGAARSGGPAAGGAVPGGRPDRGTAPPRRDPAPAPPEFVPPEFAGLPDGPADDMPPDEGYDDEPSPDDQVVQGSELSGMDLIQRELGGQVIGEFDD